MDVLAAALRGFQAFTLAALPGLERQPVFLQPDALIAQMPESQKVSALIQSFPSFALKTQSRLLKLVYMYFLTVVLYTRLNVIKQLNFTLATLAEH